MMSPVVFGSVTKRPEASTHAVNTDTTPEEDRGSTRRTPKIRIQIICANCNLISGYTAQII